MVTGHHQVEETRVIGQGIVNIIGQSDGGLMMRMVEKMGESEAVEKVAPIWVVMEK